jgi:hypothetical protein
VISQYLCLNLHPSRSREERCSLELCCAACGLHVRGMLIGWVMSILKSRAGRSWRAARSLQVTLGLALKTNTNTYPCTLLHTKGARFSTNG